MPVRCLTNHLVKSLFRNSIKWRLPCLSFTAQVSGSYWNYFMGRITISLKSVDTKIHSFTSTTHLGFLNPYSNSWWLNFQISWNQNWTISTKVHWSFVQRQCFRHDRSQQCQYETQHYSWWLWVALHLIHHAFCRLLELFFNHYNFHCPVHDYHHERCLLYVFLICTLKYSKRLLQKRIPGVGNVQA